MSCCSWVEDCLVQRVQIQKCLPEVRDDGQALYSDLICIPAHVELYDSSLSGSDGVEQVTRHLIITTIEIHMSDRVWLPWADKSEDCEAREPTSVSVCIDPDTCQPSHYEVVV